MDLIALSDEARDQIKSHVYPLFAVTYSDIESLNESSLDTWVDQYDIRRRLIFERDRYHKKSTETPEEEHLRMQREIFMSLYVWMRSLGFGESADAAPIGEE